MNYPPHYPGNIPGFSNLRKEDRSYFSELDSSWRSIYAFVPIEDSINLSDTDRLLFLSHFNAIGRMWDELSKILNQKEEQFKQKFSILRIDTEDDYVILDLVHEGIERKISTDTLGELADTDIPLSETDDDSGYPEIAIKIASAYGDIWTDIERRVVTFCRCLGFKFEWDGWNFTLEGNGIKTRGSTWSNDNDSLFEYMVASPEKVKP